MIDVRFQTSNSKSWHTVSFKDTGTFQAWKDGFNTSLRRFEAYRGFRCIERKAPAPFYLKVLNIFPW